MSKFVSLLHTRPTFSLISVWRWMLNYCVFWCVLVPLWAVGLFLSVATTFSRCVTLIRCRITDEQMIRRYARSVIARMQNIHAMRYAAMRKYVGHPVSALQFSVYSTRSLPVSGSIKRPLPYPTSGNRIIFSPCEQAFDIGNFCTQHMSTTNVHKLVGGVK